MAEKLHLLLHLHVLGKQLNRTHTGPRSTQDSEGVGREGQEGSVCGYWDGFQCFRMGLGRLVLLVIRRMYV